jgi:hypothetical protein
MASNMVGNMYSSKASAAEDNKNSELALVGAAFASVAVLVYHWFAEGEFSAVLTLSSIFQCLAFCLLGVHALLTGSVRAISAKSLQMEAIALTCRLSATLWVQGYVPTDQTGEGLYQFFDVLALILVLGLLYRVLNAEDKTYELEADSLPIMPFVAGSIVLACLCHSKIMQYRFFDYAWMFGLFVGAVAVVPQLWMMTRRGGSTPALASHFIAVMACARFLSGIYMWYACDEFHCVPWIGSFCHAGWAAVSAQAVHILLLSDFAYIYVKNLANGGLRADLEVPSIVDYV